MKTLGRVAQIVLLVGGAIALAVAVTRHRTLPKRSTVETRRALTDASQEGSFGDSSADIEYVPRNGSADDPPTDREKHVEREPPNDPPQAGPCDLLLRIETETGAPVDCVIDLWRLDAPANANWSGGDQLQTTVSTHQGSVLVSGLPAGRFRTVVGAAARKSEDPPPFSVQGGRSEVLLVCLPPCRFEVSVRVVDPTGRPVHRTRVRELDYYVFDQDRRPTWAKRRRLLDGGDDTPTNPSIVNRKPETRGWHEVSLSDGVLKLGGHLGASKAHSNKRIYEIHGEQVAPIRVSVVPSDERELSLLAVCVPLDDIWAALVRVKGVIDQEKTLRSARVEAVRTVDENWRDELRKVRATIIAVHSPTGDRTRGEYALDGTFEYVDR